MPFDKYGFLGKQIEQISEEIYARYKELFDLALNINSFIQDIKFEFHFIRDNPQHVITGGLFSKINASVQSIVILLYKGLLSDASSVCRTSIETLIKLKAIALDEKLALQYIEEGDLHRKKWMNVINDDNHKVYLPQLKDSLDQSDLAELNVRLKGKEPLTVQRWAELAKLETLYDYAYRMQNDDVHSNPKIINKYLQLDENGQVISIKCEPDCDGLDVALNTVIYVALEAVDCMCVLFNLDYTEKIEQFRTLLLELHE